MTQADGATARHFSATHRTLPMALLRAREVIMDRFRPLLHEHGITEQQWRVLRNLQENSPQDASDLARNVNVLGPSLTRIIKTLQAKDLINTARGQSDGRRVMISLTATGEDFIHAVAPGSAKIYSEIEDQLGRDHIESLLDDLESLISALSEKS